MIINLGYMARKLKCFMEKESFQFLLEGTETGKR